MREFGAVARVATVTSVLVLVVAACGSAPPSAPAGTGGAAQPGVASASPAADASGLLGIADSPDPVAASQKELELVHEIRDDTGLPALVGKQGAETFATLDRIEADFGLQVLQEASAKTAGLDLLASVDNGSDTPAAAPDALDLSVFADTGFTTSAFMGLFALLVERAAQSGEAVLPRQEHFKEDSNGQHQEIDLNTLAKVRTGNGKVSADITMTATDRISDIASGSFVALYTSTSTGHFDVNACPDKDGIGAGTYTFTTKHELNDVSGSANAQSAAGRSVDAPFRLINSDDAVLQRIEASLSLKADGRGPGTAGGPGPTAPFDWGATQQLQVVIPAKGGVSETGAAAALTGSGGAQSGGAMFISQAMAQLFLEEVGKEAEKFWRSGECIDLKPSDDTRKVQPNEKISLTVEAKPKFDTGDIRAPITAKFTGTKSLDPAGTPVDPPAKFSFVAGANKDDKGTINLKQTSKRGIGLREIVFTVGGATLQVSVDATIHQDELGNVYDTAIHLKPLDLKPDPGGTYKGHGTVHWTTTYRPPTSACKPKTYTGTFDTDVLAILDPVDPTRVTLSSSFIPGVLKPEVLHCTGRDFPFSGGTTLGIWVVLSAPQSFPLDQPTRVPTPNVTGTSKLTITVKKPASS